MNTLSRLLRHAFQCDAESAIKRPKTMLPKKTPARIDRK